MKKLIAVLLLLTLCLGLAACKRDDPTPDGMQNASDETVKFNLYVPLTWSVTTSGGVVGACFSSSDRSNVIVTSYYPESTMTLTEYWEQKCLTPYRSTLAGFTLLEEHCGETTLGGRGAAKYVFVYSLGETAYQVMQVITSYQNIVYTFTYTATTEQYQQHLSEVESMLAVLTFR